MAECPAQGDELTKSGTADPVTGRSALGIAGHCVVRFGLDTRRRGCDVQGRLRSLVAAVATAAAGVAVAPPAAADCNYAGGSTLCSSGDVRGGSSNSPAPSAPYSPYPCYDYGDPLCLYYDNYDPGIIFDPPNVGIGIGGRPVDPGYGVGRPGIGGGRPGGGIGRG